MGRSGRSTCRPATIAMKSRNRWHSFMCAVNGLVYTLRTQRNTRIELAATAVVIVAGMWLRIEPVDWALLALTVGMILALEAVNSAIEALVDLVSPEYHDLARIAKDCAAGAMLFAVLGSLGVALAIFGPRVWALIATSKTVSAHAASRSAASPSTTNRKWWGRTLPAPRS